MKKILLACALVGITFFAFEPSLRNQFVNWDDEAIIIRNPLIQDLSLPGIKRIFTSLYQDNAYKPLVKLSFALEYHFFGLNPFVYHLDNIIVHLFNCLLVFWLIFLLSRKTGVSFITALLFGVHPLRVESVAWAVERKDVLYSFFFLCALVVYMYYQKKASWRKYIACLILFIFSMLSKPAAVIFPFTLCVIDFFTRRRLNAKLVLEKVPFVVIGAIIITFSYISYKHFGSAKVISSHINPLLLICYGLVWYMQKTIVPLNLSCIYPYPMVIEGLVLLRFIFSPLIVLSGAAAVFFSLRYQRKAAFGFLFFLVTIFPLLQLVPTGPFIAADRYTYLPLIGVFYVTGEGGNWLYRHAGSRLKTALLIVGFILIGLLVGLTRARTKIWLNSLTLWNDVIKRYPAVPLAYNDRGEYYKQNQQWENAIADFNKAIAFNPDYAGAYYNRGSIYQAQGFFDRALEDYSKAIELMPGYAEAYNNLGNTYRDKSDLNAAIAEYDRALSINPNYAQAYYNRATAYYELKEYGKCREDLFSARRLGFRVPEHFLRLLQDANI